MSEVKKLARGGRTILFENRYRCKNGSYKWLQWNANSLGARRQIYAIARDVTLRKNLEIEILETADREKERLGRELHDGLCQNLAGIAALSAALSRKLAADSESTAIEAAEIAKLLNETIGHARDMARGLNPLGLEQIVLPRRSRPSPPMSRPCSGSPADSSVIVLISGLALRSRRTFIASPRKP
ncbi:MAG: histidine kinase [Deltaproteobacteria bacterium]|nr:histidine kinase [Deltaproteobacteria bacterium]